MEWSARPPIGKVAWHSEHKLQRYLRHSCLVFSVTKSCSHFVVKNDHVDLNGIYSQEINNHLSKSLHRCSILGRVELSRYTSRPPPFSTCNWVNRHCIPIHDEAIIIDNHIRWSLTQITQRAFNCASQSVIDLERFSLCIKDGQWSGSSSWRNVVFDFCGLLLAA